jgi:two-component system, chemotaxis family, chemotaxis protein CheY
VDIVFVDINMPKMNGIEFVQRMAKTHLLEQIPVVIVSTERAEARIEQLRNFGIRAYLPKPFRPEDLRDIVADLLEKKGSPRAQ